MPGSSPLFVDMFPPTVIHKAQKAVDVTCWCVIQKRGHAS